MRHVVFVHGAGEDAFEEDEAMANALRQGLANRFGVVYPRMPTSFEATYEDWTAPIAVTLERLEGPVNLVGHSVGGSVLLKYLSETRTPSVAGVHVLAAPFWGADDFWSWEPARLHGNANDELAYVPRLFMYHSQDDEVVPFAHLALYRSLLPGAVFRELDGRGHQFGDDLSEVVADIRST